jgi:putative ABC transport system permease protein
MSALTWRIVRGELRDAPARVAVLALAIAIATMILVGAMSGSAIARREIPASFERSRPPHLVVSTDRDLNGLGIEGIAAVAPRRAVSGRIRLDGGAWTALRVVLLADWQPAPVGRVELLGDAPVGRDIAVERSSVPVLGAGVGANVELRLPGGRTVASRVTTLAADGSAAPGWQDHVVYAYVTPATLTAWGISISFDDWLVLLTPAADPERVTAQLRSALGADVEVTRPSRRHPHADQMNAVLVLVIAFAAFSLVVCAALTATLVLAGMARDRRLIGVMRAVGASHGTVSWLRVLPVLLVGAVGAVVGIAPGLMLGDQLATFIAEQLNLVDPAFTVPWSTTMVAAVVAWLVPTITAWIVVRRALHASVREVLAGEPTVARVHTATGRPSSAATGVMQRMQWRRLQGNVARAGLSIIALAAGSGALMVAGHTYQSLRGAVDESFENRSDDIELRVTNEWPRDSLRAVVADLPGVGRVETWGALRARVRRADGSLSGRLGLLAPPPASQLFRTPSIKGRWLAPNARGEAVVSRNLAAFERSMRLGSTVTFVRDGRTTTVTVVGLVDDVTAPVVYTDPATHAGLADVVDGAGVLRLTVTEPLDSVLPRVEDAFFRRGVIPAGLVGRAEYQASIRDHFIILLVLLLTAGGASVIVGGLAIASATSISLLERWREIGVLRALGTPDPRMLRLLLGEGMLTAGVAVAAAIVVAVPGAYLVNMVLGSHALHIALPLRLSGAGVLIASAVSLTVAAVATVIPVRQALRHPVRAMLAQE